MSDYVKMVEVMECDYYRYLPPKQILEHCLSYILYDIRQEGVGREVLQEHFSAVWMISRMKYIQYAPVHPGDYLTYRVHPRAVIHHHYVYLVEIFRGDRLVITLNTIFIPVHFTERHIIPVEEVDPLWHTPEETGFAESPGRLFPQCAFTPCGEDTVRMSDCDGNLHMTSGAYLSLACDYLKLWEGARPRYMSMMQVDFNREAQSGMTLRMLRGEQNGVHFVRALKPDGTPAFTAACTFGSDAPQS